MREKTELKNNTLFNAIIRIDLFKIENLPNVLKRLVKYAEENNFKFRTNDIKSVNINIDDPETLLTQEMIKANIDETKNYEIISQDEKEKFVINEYFLIFEKSDFEGYAKIDKYITHLKEIFNIIVSVEKNINISRVGIRKANHLFINDISFISKYINYQLPCEDYKLIDEYSIMQKNLSTISSNIIFTLKKGTYIKDKDEVGEMYRAVWDIDCYKRNVAIKTVLDTINSLNEEVFFRYRKIITDDLYHILCENDLTEEYLKAQKIYGGICKNDE